MREYDMLPVYLVLL